jgi:hypothetical protein
VNSSSSLAQGEVSDTGFSHDIRNYLSARISSASKYKAILNGAMGILFLVGIINLGFVGSMIVKNNNKFYIPCIFSAIIFSAEYLLAKFTKNECVIYLKKDSEATFWVRNKERIIVGLINSIISGSVGVLIGMLLSK